MGAIAQREQIELQDRVREVSEADHNLRLVNESLRVNRERLVEAEAAERENAIREAWIERLTPARDLLHREAAPRFVSQMNLQRVSRSINDHLERFAADFRVRPDEGLTFMARKMDGVEEVAERLSKGQQVVLALAFRLSVNFMYSDLGFLSLDEPTAYLDARHIAGFEPSLNRLREYTTSRGLQCIMVTHEQSLAHLFDSVIQL
jgi:DNA repair exonuclease SbcCD ATPase subunit